MSEKYRKGEYTNCRYDICEIVDGDGDVFCTVATEDADLVIGVLNENMQLKDDLKKKFVPFARADENGVTTVDTEEFIAICKENEELKEFKEKVLDEIGNELDYLKERANDNPVNRGRIQALEQLERWLLIQ